MSIKLVNSNMTESHWFGEKILDIINWFKSDLKRFWSTFVLHDKMTAGSKIKQNLTKPHLIGLISKSFFTTLVPNLCPSVLNFATSWLVTVSFLYAFVIIGFPPKPNSTSLKGKRFSSRSKSIKAICRPVLRFSRTSGFATNWHYQNFAWWWLFLFWNFVLKFDDNNFAYWFRSTASNQPLICFWHTF